MSKLNQKYINLLKVNILFLSVILIVSGWGITSCGIIKLKSKPTQVEKQEMKNSPTVTNQPNKNYDKEGVDSTDDDDPD